MSHAGPKRDDCNETPQPALAPANCCDALVEKIKDARQLSETCWIAGYRNENVHQRHYSAGQLDAFDAVLSWIREAQHNSDYATVVAYPDRK